MKIYSEHQISISVGCFFGYSVIVTESISKSSLLPTWPPRHRQPLFARIMTETCRWHFRGNGMPERDTGFVE